VLAVELGQTDRIQPLTAQLLLVVVLVGVASFLALTVVLVVVELPILTTVTVELVFRGKETMAARHTVLVTLVDALVLVVVVLVQQALDLILRATTVEPGELLLLRALLAVLLNTLAVAAAAVEILLGLGQVAQAAVAVEMVEIEMVTQV
jgi:hypothetical protein